VPVFHIVVKGGGRSGRAEWSGGMDGHSNDAFGTDKLATNKKKPYLYIGEHLEFEGRVSTPPSDIVFS
jgi:hypothetical protein